jgi:hypothetical protein
MRYLGMMHDGGDPGLSAEEYQAQLAADEAARLAAEDAYFTVKVGSTGMTQAQLDAQTNAIETAKLIGGTTIPNPNGAGLYVVPPKPTVPPVVPVPPAKVVTQPVILPVQNPTVNPTPNNPPPNVPANPPPAIKTATPQYVTFNDDEVPIDVVVDLLFENVGGQELLSISRHDTVLGQKILYQPFKNLNIIKEEYNPNNLVRLQQTSDKFFANYTIKLADKIPTVGNGLNGDNVYLDTDGNLVIEFINIATDEQTEVQITTNGTIYEAGI